MPIKGGVGYSEQTPNKMQGFQAIIRQELSVIKNILPQREWASQTMIYIDANAGPGYNDEMGYNGSPIMFLEIVQQYGLEYSAFFIDIRENNINLLKQRIPNYSNHKVILGNNKERLPEVVARIPPKSYGVLYIDPTNKWREHLDLVAAVSKHPKMRYLDILIRYSPSGIKRSEYITGKKTVDYLAKINKKYWIVRDIEKHDKFQWTFLFGLNWGLSPWKGQGFHNLNSPEGQKILDTLNFTNEERNNRSSPSLFSL